LLDNQSKGQRLGFRVSYPKPLAHNTWGVAFPFFR